ncbi:hypothetical protein ALC60_08161, partial [Trachymyrmex zeteki]
DKKDELSLTSNYSTDWSNDLYTSKPRNFALTIFAGMPLPAKKSKFKVVIIFVAIMLDVRFRNLFIILISAVFGITLGQSCIFFFFFFFFCFEWFLSAVVFIVVSFLLVVVVGRGRIGIVNSNNGAAVVTLGLVGTSSSPVNISNRALKPNGSSSSSSDSCASTSEPSGTEFVMGLSSSSSSSSSSEPSPKKSSSSSSSEASSVSIVGSDSAGRSFRPSGPNLKFEIELRNTIFHTT